MYDLDDIEIPDLNVIVPECTNLNVMVPECTNSVKNKHSICSYEHQNKFIIPDFPLPNDWNNNSLLPDVMKTENKYRYQGYPMCFTYPPNSIKNSNRLSRDFNNKKIW